MSGAILPPPNMPTWRGAQLKHRDNLLNRKLIKLPDITAREDSVQFSNNNKVPQQQ